MSKETLTNTLVGDLLFANKQYANSFGDKASLSLPPSKKLAILTCMDARLDPAKFLGIEEGQAHIIRNAGGRASDDAIRSLIISHKLLGTSTWLLIHHSDCGMQTFDDLTIRKLLKESLSTAALTEDGWQNVQQEGGSEAADFIPFLAFSDLEESVREDLQRIRNHPLVNPEIELLGYIFDVKSGNLLPINGY